MKAKKDIFFILYALLVTMVHQIVAMENGMNKRLKNEEVFQKFEEGSKVGNVVSRTFFLDKQQIDEIAVNGAANVALYQIGSDEEGSVTIRAEENIIDQLQVAIIDKCKLAIGQRPGNIIQPRKSILYCIALENITGVFCTGSVKVRCLSPLKGNELRLTLQGTSEFVADGYPYSIDTELLAVTLQDSSTVSLAGRAQHQEIFLSDEAEHDAKDVETNTFYVKSCEKNKMKVGMTDFPAGYQGVYIKGISDLMRKLSGLRNFSRE